ncbi:Recombination protein O [Serratia fonticola]|uniref:DNA repair protein RecO n=1 Tax=Serratia fonticola TaxID=47917 RepID=A0A4U9UH62_SERFO|nr:Recombination protein O [Serratia fonticola]
MDGWERAFVLHGRPFSETSLMLDLFTEGHGRVRLLAKGARSRRSNLKGCLQPFTPLLVRWGGRGEVKTLRGAEAVSLGLPLSGMMLYSGLYVNELLSRVLEQEGNYSVLFFDYLQCLQALAAEDAPRSMPCGSSSWRCWGTWVTGWISSIVLAAASRWMTA